VMPRNPIRCQRKLKPKKQGGFPITGVQALVATAVIVIGAVAVYAFAPEVLASGIQGAASDVLLKEACCA